MAFTDIVFTSGRATAVWEMPAGAGPASAIAPGVSMLDALSALYNGTRPELPNSGSPARSLVEAINALPEDTADKLLGRSLAGSADGGRTVQDALRAARNKTAIVGTTLTVYQEDDATPAWTATIATGSRDPLTSIDPA